MKLIVGLGNPGSNHLFTRHNIGFMLIDALAKDSSFQNKHKSLIQKIKISDELVILAKPQTYMNLSGEAVREIMAFYKIDVEDLLVVQDDKDQNFLSIKFQQDRGYGGHNGIKSIHQQLKTETYTRLKLGIANSSITRVDKKEDAHSSFTKLSSIKSPTNQYSNLPNYQHDYKIPTSDFVLSNFNEQESKQLPNFLEQSSQATICFIEKGFKATSNQFNKKI